MSAVDPIAPDISRRLPTLPTTPDAIISLPTPPTLGDKNSKFHNASLLHNIKPRQAADKGAEQGLSPLEWGKPMRTNPHQTEQTDNPCS